MEASASAADAKRRAVICASASAILHVVSTSAFWAKLSKSTASSPLEDDPDQAAAVYAARKRMRRDESVYPREYRYSDPLSFVSGSPSRPVVNVQRAHRLPINTDGQWEVMQQWTPDEWLSHVRVSKHLFLWLVDTLQPHVIVRDAGTGGKPVRPAWCQVGAILSWLGGARPVDLYDTYGMRKTCF
jgi:hypothetical protein